MRRSRLIGRAIPALTHSNSSIIVVVNKYHHKTGLGHELRNIMYYQFNSEIISVIPITSPPFSPPVRCDVSSRLPYHPGMGVK